MSELAEIQDWYAAHCDGEREHLYSISIQSLDNPGWHVKIDLRDSELEQATFTPIFEGDQDERTYDSWLRCFVRDSRFEGAGDPARLQQILRLFLDWAHSNAATHLPDS